VSATDLLIAGSVLAGAGLLLIRSFSSGKGGCAGCHGGGCGRSERPPQRLVALGGSRPSAPRQALAGELVAKVRHGGEYPAG
jgi:hypothetical protein